MRRKRGQKDASGAAGLIGIILLLIIFYIVFLPPQDRADLLEDDNGINGDDNGDEDLENKTLLDESPGTLSVVDRRDADRELPNVFLFEARESQVLERFNPFTVRNGVFDEKGKVLNFRLDDLENTNNVLMSFTTPKHNGVLTIGLNGIEIFESDIDVLNPDPVRLDGSNLEESNELKFEVSSVGYRFWTTNEYNFEDIRIIGDVTDTTKQRSQNVFTLKEEEFQNLEKATIRFVPYCSRESEVGVLDVFINNRQVYSATPVCDDPVRQDFPIGVLNSGTNNIIFKSERGSYSIEQIKFDLDLKETKSVVYFFEINQSDFDNILDDDLDAILEIQFVDDGEDKTADLNINDHLRRMDLDNDEDEFRMNIDGFVEEGNNFIEIRPKTILRIIELEVRLED